ncbi:MAG: hypothetical protein CVT49_16335 [candidate division Zixibacteria bacterium HGW-Zixibacteria-1]|nr:MAG: hypothetical protein CVT49_16335 [candidate division Zixibacteria bacterium HGW-Zixibacteria-1]
MQNGWDFFICHASEDKQDVVEPLASELRNQGAKVWLDSWVLKIGDSLSEKINEGLIHCKYGIVILSPSFFEKSWPQKELSGLVQKEIGGQKVILPIWHNVDRQDVFQRSPILADRVAGNTRNGVKSLAIELMEIISIVANIPNTNAPSNTVKQAARIEIGFKEKNIISDLHIYGLKIIIALIIPPDQGRMRFKFSWPQYIKIIDSQNLDEIESTFINGAEYRQILVNWEQRIFPGETIELLGMNSRHKLYYRFDHGTYNYQRKNKCDLNYTLYLEDHLPISGSISFDKLNIF